MKTLAIIKDSVVIDTILINDDSDGWEKPENTISVDVTGERVGVGFTYDEENKIFTNPALENHVDG